MNTRSWSDWDAYPAWAYVDEPWARDGLPDDPSADAADRAGLES